MSHEGKPVTKFLPAEGLRLAIESTYRGSLNPVSRGFITAEEAARRRAEREAWQRAHPWRYRAQKIRRATRLRTQVIRRALAEHIGGPTLHQDCNDY